MELMYLRKSRADGEHETVEEVLHRHEQILQEYALKTYGHQIPEQDIFREVVSGETIQSRPQMCRVLELLQSRAVDAVLVVDPQRLSRGDLRDCGTVIRAFQYTSTLVATPQKNYDLSDKFDRKFLEMELMRGNDYLEYVKEIMLRGRIASVNEGNYIGSTPPFGYERVKVDKYYTLQESADADAVRLIFELYVNEGCGYAEICKRLDALGVKPKKRADWVPASIKDILANPVYIGKIRWNWRRTVKQYHDGEITKTRPKAPESDWILVEGKHPALISEELFQAAQEKRGKHPRTQTERTLRNPFAGMCKCECGSAMVLKPCARAQLRIMCQHQTHCHSKSLIYADYERAVIRALQENAAALEAQYTAAESKTDQLQQSLLENLRREQAEIERQQERLYELLERGIYTEPVFLQRNAALQARREATETAIQTAKETAATTETIRARILALQDAITIIQNTDLTPKSKNALLRPILKEIRCHSPQSPEDSPTLTLTLNL